MFDVKKLLNMEAALFLKLCTYHSGYYLTVDEPGLLFYFRLREKEKKLLVSKKAVLHS